MGALSVECSPFGCLFPYQFIGMFGPGQVAHLGASVSALQGLARQRVPEAEAAVGGASTRCQQPVLVGGPRDGLDRRKVVTVLLHWEQTGAVPHQQLEGTREQRGRQLLEVLL